MKYRMLVYSPNRIFKYSVDSDDFATMYDLYYDLKEVDYHMILFVNGVVYNGDLSDYFKECDF